MSRALVAYVLLGSATTAQAQFSFGIGSMAIRRKRALLKKLRGEQDAQDWEKREERLAERLVVRLAQCRRPERARHLDAQHHAAVSVCPVYNPTHNTTYSFLRNIFLEYKYKYNLSYIISRPYVMMLCGY